MCENSLEGHNATVTTRTKKPQPPTDKLPREVCGGSWHYASANGVRAAFRFDCTPLGRYGILGFRLAQSGCCQVLKVTP